MGKSRVYSLRFFKVYFKSFLDIFFPRLCLNCGGSLLDEEGICRRCLDFKKNPPPYCRRCGRHIDIFFQDRLCPRCKKGNFYFDKAFSPFIFESPLSEVIYLYKYRGYHFLGKLLAEKMAEVVKDFFPDIEDYEGVTFVPLHKRKYRQRGYNQTYILASFFSDFFGLPLYDFLGVRSYKPSQTRLKFPERLRNVEGNFYIKSRPLIERVILIDDVLTTGSTFSECARVLKEGGVKYILALSLSVRSYDEDYS